MLTRHFYESDEVVEALRWSVVRGRVIEAAFWCEELVCSGEEAMAWGSLFSVWMEQALIVAPDWADRWFGVGGDIHEACADLCHTGRMRRDISLPLVLLVGATQVQGPPPEKLPLLEKPASVAPKSTPLRTKKGSKAHGSGLAITATASTATAITSPIVAIYDYFERACAAGKGQAAWWAAQQLGHSLRDRPLPSAGPRLFDYLERLILPGNLDGWRAAFMCAAVLLECEGHLKPFKSLPSRSGGSSKPVKELERWEGLEGRRARREFSVPREALLCVTERGRMKSNITPLYRVYTAHERIEAGEGCSFWTDIIAHYRTEDGNWITAEAQDAFYELAFPDDIPDEWSKSDQLQSHGPGCLSSSEAPRWVKWGRLWLDADAIFAWGVSPVTLLDSMTAPTEDTATWLDCFFAPAPPTDAGVAGAGVATAPAVAGWGGEDIDTDIVLSLVASVRKILVVE